MNKPVTRTIAAAVYIKLELTQKVLYTAEVQKEKLPKETQTHDHVRTGATASLYKTEPMDS